MSALWIIITGFSILSALLVVGLAVWRAQMERQEWVSFNNLHNYKWRLAEAINQDPEIGLEGNIIKVLSEMTFPLQKNAESLKARTEINLVLADMIAQWELQKEATSSSREEGSGEAGTDADLTLEDLIE